MLHVKSTHISITTRHAFLLMISKNCTHEAELLSYNHSFCICCSLGVQKPSFIGQLFKQYDLNGLNLKLVVLFHGEMSKKKKTYSLLLHNNTHPDFKQRRFHMAADFR